VTYGLYILVSTLGGLLVGLLGTGSSLIILPSLSLIFAGTMAAYEPLRLAAGTTMATIAIGAISGAVSQYRYGQVDLRLFRLMLVPYVLGGFAGPWMNRLLPSKALSIYVAAIIFVVAVRMLMPRRLRAGPARDIHGAEREIGVVLLAIGFFSSIAGIATGIFSIPYLSRFALPLRTVIGTSTASAAVYASCGALGYIGAGWLAPDAPHGTVGFVYLPAFAIMATTAALTTPLGVRLARHVNERVLKQVFAIFLLASAAAILYA
jgi:uncharacterized membrane protein YfcA